MRRWLLLCLLPALCAWGAPPPEELAAQRLTATEATAFATDLLHKLPTGRNVALSPHSLSTALSLAYVADGRFDAFIQESNLSAWDVAAAGLIAERAGATVTDIDGGAWFDVLAPSGSISIVAAPQPHHARLLELLAD